MDSVCLPSRRCLSTAIRTQPGDLVKADELLADVAHLNRNPFRNVRPRWLLSG
jgi:hypothetical protein